MSEDATKITDLDEQAATPPVVAEPKKSKAKAAAPVEQVEEEAPAAEAKVASKVGAAGLSGKKVEITVHTGEGEHGKFPADVSINGVRYRIKRNEKVTVPVEVLEILQNATRKTYSQSSHGKDQSVNTIPRFPLSVHRFLP